MKRAKVRFACIALASVSMLAITPALADGMSGSTPWGEAVVLMPSAWSGFYVGGHLGAALDQRAFSIQDLSAAQDLFLPSPAEDQILIGLHGGYNWQVQQIVLGVEGDVSFSNDANYLASIRGRLGFAPWDRLLLYGTAGAAFIDLDEPFAIAIVSHGSLSVQLATAPRQDSSLGAAASTEFCPTPALAPKVSFMILAAAAHCSAPHLRSEVSPSSSKTTSISGWSVAG